MAKITRNNNTSASHLSGGVVPLGSAWLNFADLVNNGKTVIDEFQKEIGRRLIEGVLYMERDAIGGASYHPIPGFKKWASQPGSVYVGKGKLKIKVPRLRNQEGEVLSPIYQSLKNPEVFSQSLLETSMAGLSGRKYGEVIDHVGERLGVAKSSISRHVKAATVRNLKKLMERRLDEFEIFTMFLDGVHKAGKVVMAAIGIDCQGNKKVLGLWEGTTENSEICKAMLSDLEHRGLSLHPNVLFITDGGAGISSALKAKFGKSLLHQRCTLHKRRNIEGHLPKEYHAEFRRRYNTAINIVEYEAAKRELLSVHRWLKGINTSAARSLEECGERLLTVHRLGLPVELRASLMTTNIIESSFNGMNYVGKNIKSYRNGGMLMRWMAAVLISREQHFHRIDGHIYIQKFTETLSKNSFNLENERLVA